MWPKWLGRLPGDVFVEEERIYYMKRNDADDLHPCRKEFLGNVPARSHWRGYVKWEFSPLHGTFVMNNGGALVICHLKKSQTSSLFGGDQERFSAASKALGH